MLTTQLPPTSLDLNGIRASVDAVIDEFLDDLDRTARHPQLHTLTGVLRDLTAAGGKRLRPLFCMVGWYAAGGIGSRGAALRLAASLELLHASLLIHDDIIDASDTRRGRPTAHRALAAHRPVGAGADGSHGRGDNWSAPSFGVSAALILGDFALLWSDLLMRSARLTPIEHQAVAPVLDTMRHDVFLGQYLDLIAARSPSADLEAALAVIRYKTARYTVEHPLQAGAALAGADNELLSACSAFGIPLGEAFQLRDDLLGVFGESEDTGKSTLDDLREGKHTPLVALALQRADSAQRAVLHRHLGRPGLSHADAAAVRAVLVATGARATVEDMIEDRYQQALAALDAAPFRSAAAQALRHLADAAVRRSA